jgi:redox-sensing transcriptional repressor
VNNVKVDKLPTVKRLPAYLRILRDLSGRGQEFVSSTQIAEIMSLDPILVRKDLVMTGIVGTPRIGYHVQDLIKSIEDFLGWSKPLECFLVGAGHLGTAILGYKEIRRFGHRIVAAFDRDSEKIGRSIHGVEVFDISSLPEHVANQNVRLAILSVHPEEAQKVAEYLVESGIQAIWNFTSANLDLPAGIMTHAEDLMSGLAVLSVKMARHL